MARFAFRIRVPGIGPSASRRLAWSLRRRTAPADELHVHVDEAAGSVEAELDVEAGTPHEAFARVNELAREAAEDAHPDGFALVEPLDVDPVVDRPLLTAGSR